jgi:hypothetical protein
MKMAANNKDSEARFTAVEERLDAVEDNVAAMKKLFTTWLDGQVTQAKQSLDPQVAFINARASQRTQGPARPVQSAEAFDGAVDRINNKRKTLLGK